ncbi:MAG: hypothetical protein ACP5IZ_10815 [Thermoprotei archaeon]
MLYTLFLRKAIARYKISKFPFPKWDFSINSGYTIREIIQKTMKILHAWYPINNFTTPEQLDNTFRVPTQLIDVFRTRTHIKASINYNSYGGIEIKGKVKSATSDNFYDFAIALGPNDDGGFAQIYEYCSCPFHKSNNQFVCKHFVLVLTTFLPEILSSLNFINGIENELKPAFYREKVNKIITDEYVEIGIIYYIIKFLSINGFITKVIINKEDLGPTEDETYFEITDNNPIISQRVNAVIKQLKNINNIQKQ